MTKPILAIRITIRYIDAIIITIFITQNSFYNYVEIIDNSDYNRISINMCHLF